MEILQRNRAAWNAIGERVTSPYMACSNYARLFDTFCDSVRPGSEVLDVGCGPGIPVTRALVEQGFRVTALDLSDTMISLAKKNVPTATLVRLSATDMTYREKFDGIVASYSLLCLDPPLLAQASQNIFRALKRDGFCFVAMNESKQEVQSAPLTKIDSQKLYSQAYSEDQLRNAFGPMNLIDIGRDVIESALYGRENGIVLLFQK